MSPQRARSIQCHLLQRLRLLDRLIQFNALGRLVHDMSSYEELILTALRNPPDPNEPLPLANRRETIYGVVISFMVRRPGNCFYPMLTIRNRFCRGQQFCFVYGFVSRSFENLAWTMHSFCSLRYVVAPIMYFIDDHD